ncbi:MAG TPA: AAA family ATPase, partial [Tepidisphaeraceae bacterium]|nr:AAA family ATPase [Tepidisphaeraceae bacterium]
MSVISAKDPAGSSLHLPHIVRASNHALALASPTLARLESSRERIGELVPRAIHLLAGPPGSRKSGLALQLALDYGVAGNRTLLLLSEEDPGRVTERSHRMLAGRGGAAARRALSSVALEVAPHDPALLGRHVEQLVLRPASPHRGINLLILDSIQGGSVSAGADAAACRAAVDAARRLQLAGIATLLVGHVTKQNAVRGPRSLEHAVDVVLHLDCRGGRRTLTVTKNRFGPAVLRPVPLAIDPVTTRLSLVSHATAQVATVRAFVPGSGFVELQAAASLPPSGGGRGAFALCRGV